MRAAESATDCRLARVAVSDDAPSSGVPRCAERQSCDRARRRSCQGRHRQSGAPMRIALPGPAAVMAARTPTRGRAARTTNRAAGSVPAARAREKEGPRGGQARGGGSALQCPSAMTEASRAARTAAAPAWRVSKSETQRPQRTMPPMSGGARSHQDAAAARYPRRPGEHPRQGFLGPPSRVRWGCRTVRCDGTRG